MKTFLSPDDPTPRSARTLAGMFRRARVNNAAWAWSAGAAACFGLSAFLRDGAGKILVTLGIVAVIYLLLFVYFRKTGFLFTERSGKRRMERRADRAFARYERRR